MPDPSANPYLAFSALLLAGLDGIKNKIEPPAPIDKNIYELPPEEYEAIDMVPTSLNAVLDSLEADHEFLTAGDVFTPDLIETSIDYKRTEEILPFSCARTRTSSSSTTTSESSPQIAPSRLAGGDLGLEPFSSVQRIRGAGHRLIF